MTTKREVQLTQGRRTSAAKTKRRVSQAASADPHELYERAVQAPELDADTLRRLYKRYRKRDAQVLREDFCGTGVLAVEWARQHEDHRAIGIDLDGQTLAWGRDRHLAEAGLGKRVKLIEANVLDGKGGKGDIVCALNFSYQAFKRREDLLRYFKTARRCLKPDGLFILDVLGGTEVMGAAEDERDLEDFTYRWEQAFFDPLTHELECRIHFDFPDGSQLSPAFSYEWRLWTMPELHDLLVEAGFSKVHRLWEKTDGDGEGTGAFFEPKRVENQESWWTYMVAER